MKLTTAQKSIGNMAPGERFPDVPGGPANNLVLGLLTGSGHLPGQTAVANLDTGKVTYYPDHTLVDLGLEKVPFHTLKPGQFFQVCNSGRQYVKTTEIKADKFTARTNATSLADGRHGDVDNDAEVFLLRFGRYSEYGQPDHRRACAG